MRTAPARGPRSGSSVRAEDCASSSGLTPGNKIEGIAAQVAVETIRPLLVTDADDENIPARLMSAEIQGYPFEQSTVALIDA